MLKYWEKADYLNWIKTRNKSPGQWRHEDCQSADQLIKYESLKLFDQWRKTNIQNKDVSDFLYSMVLNNFGSAGVDNLLTKLNCYPDWL